MNSVYDRYMKYSFLLKHSISNLFQEDVVEYRLRKNKEKHFCHMCMYDGAAAAVAARRLNFQRTPSCRVSYTQSSWRRGNANESYSQIDPRSRSSVAPAEAPKGLHITYSIFKTSDKKCFKTKLYCFQWCTQFQS